MWIPIRKLQIFFSAANWIRDMKYEKTFHAFSRNLQSWLCSTPEKLRILINWWLGMSSTRDWKNSWNARLKNCKMITQKFGGENLQKSRIAKVCNANEGKINKYQQIRCANKKPFWNGRMSSNQFGFRSGVLLAALAALNSQLVFGQRRQICVPVQLLLLFQCQCRSIDAILRDDRA